MTGTHPCSRGPENGQQPCLTEVVPVSSLEVAVWYSHTSNCLQRWMVVFSVITDFLSGLSLYWLLLTSGQEASHLWVAAIMVMAPLLRKVSFLFPCQ